MADFQVGDLSFRSQKIGLEKSVNVLARIGPFIPSMIIAYRAFDRGANLGDAAIAMGDEILLIFAKMSDEDRQYVLRACLDVTQVQQGDAWVPVANNGRLMFQTLGHFEVAQIIWKVLDDTFKDFFTRTRAALSARPVQATESNGSE